MMRTDSPARLALAVGLPLILAAVAHAQEPEPAETKRPLTEQDDHAFSVVLPHFGGNAQLGISLDSDQATDSIGARIRDVIDDGPAEMAGLRAGDIITTIDGRSIARRDASDAGPDQQLVRRLRGVLPGDTVRIDYRRDGQQLAANVIATERERLYRTRRIDLPSFDVDVPNVWRAEWSDGALRFGHGASLELAEMNAALGEYFGVDHGVLVIDVRNDSSLGLEAGDVILRIGGRDVRDAGHARSIIASYRNDEPVQIELMRDRQRQTVTGRAR